MQLRPFTKINTGIFIGHMIPALSFAGFGAYMLVLSLLRARKLPPGKTFCECHVPERDPATLMMLGKAIIPVTSIGYLFEITGEFMNSDYHPFTHKVLFLSFWSVGVIAVLEGKGRLPLDSGRRSLAVILLLQFLMMYDHALNEGLGPTDLKFHIGIAYIYLVNAFTVMYSVMYPTSVVAFIAGWALLLLQGTWFATLALHYLCVEISKMHVVALFSMEVLGIMLLIAVAVALFLPHSNIQGDDAIAFSPLVNKAENDNEGEFTNDEESQDKFDDI